MSPFFRFTLAVLLAAITIIGGTIGYSLIEGWPLSDGFYMTFITITTVGFQEVQELSASGRYFTIILLVFGLLTLGYSVTIFITYIFEGQIMHSVKERRMKQVIRRLKEHYIVCGAGVVGREVIAEFQRKKARFVVIERDLEHSELSPDDSFPVIEGDAEDDDVLRMAHIESATGLVAALPDDQSNLFVVLTARQLNKNLHIVTQATSFNTSKKLMKAGADRVISPVQIAGRRMASVLLRPSVVNFLDIVVQGNDLSMRLEEIPIGESSPLINKTLRETGIGQNTGAIVIGIYGPDGSTRINPDANSTLSGVNLNKDDVLIALGNEDQLNSLKTFAVKGG
jgi:voltage-gated potassium channel